MIKPCLRDRSQAGEESPSVFRLSAVVTVSAVVGSPAYRQAG